MEPVGQKPPFGERIPSQNALPEEFLLRLVDLSRASLPGPKLSLVLPSDLLARLFGPVSSPVRFELRSPEVRKALEALLDKSMAGSPQPMLSLGVAREGNRLAWSFRGKGGEISLTSPLLEVRPGVIPLEGVRTLPAEPPVLEPPLPPLLPWLPVDRWPSGRLSFPGGHRSFLCGGCRKKKERGLLKAGQRGLWSFRSISPGKEGRMASRLMKMSA